MKRDLRLGSWAMHKRSRHHHYFASARRLIQTLICFTMRPGHVLSRALGVGGRPVEQAGQGDEAACSITQQPSDSTCWLVERSKQTCVFTVFHDLPTALSSLHFVWGRRIVHPQNCVPAAQVRRQTFQFPTKGDAELRMQARLGGLRLAGWGKDVCIAHVASSEVMATRVRNVWGTFTMAPPPQCGHCVRQRRHDAHCWTQARSRGMLAARTKRWASLTRRGWQQRSSVPAAPLRSHVDVAEDWPHGHSEKFRQRKIREKSVLTALGHPGSIVEAKSTFAARRNLWTGMLARWNWMICTQHQIMEKRPTSRDVAVARPGEWHQLRRSAGGTAVTTRPCAGRGMPMPMEGRMRDVNHGEIDTRRGGLSATTHSHKHGLARPTYLVPGARC